MPDMKVIARRSKSPNKVLPAEAVHCSGCGRVWVRDEDTGFEDCPRCHRELHPVGRKIVVGEELRTGDHTEVRVSQDQFLQEVYMTLSTLADRIACDCTSGITCLRCRAEAVLRQFPTTYEYASGTLEEAWATLRPDRRRPEPKPDPSRVRKLPDIELDLDD